MASKMTFNFSLDTSAIVNRVKSILDDPYVLRDVHRLMAEMCEEYVPFDTGKLNRGTYYDKNGVHYGVHIPYAHYVYEGIVFGPNVPYIVEIKDRKTGEVKKRELRWSSPISPKHPTGDMEYNNEWVLDGDTIVKQPKSAPVHPNATRHWDEAMFRDRGDEFIAGIDKIIQRRLKKLNG